jgi:GT2 family glycosyltransferase
MELKVFVIVVTYKGRQWYDRCFKSLRNSTIPVQTIVVDNASNDGSVEYIREHFPEIHLIESEENLGFGRANNIAMRYALDHGGDFVFLLNQDTWIELDAIQKLVEIHARHPEYGILSPLHLAPDGKRLNMLIDDGRILYKKNLDMLGDLWCGNSREVYTIRYVNAAAWLLPRKTLETVGGFDPIYYHYEEDDDYLNRVYFHHLPVGLCPQSRIVHDHSNLFGTLPVSKTRIHRDQKLKVRFADPGADVSISMQRRYLARKVLVLFVRGKRVDAKNLWQDFVFLGKNRKAIENSKRENAKKQSSWL